jgi:flagellar protein FlgJ
MSELTSASSKLVLANTGLAMDTTKLEALKHSASTKSPEATKAVAQQFEALFLGMMLKSMRDAIPKDEDGNSDATKTYMSMLDQQLAQALSTRGGLGIAAMLEKQLSKQKTETSPQTSKSEPVVSVPRSTTIPPNSANTERLMTGLSGTSNKKLSTELTDGQINQYSMTPSQSTKTLISRFKEMMASAADAASRTSGIPPVFILAQAALESGWGKSEVIDLNGSKSHNLFGIKATGSWKGKVAEALTTEFVNGKEIKVIAKFRAYDSYTDSFADFAQLIKNSARYQPLAQHLQDPVSYGQAMQDAGYATDPDYAKKLSKTIFMFLNNKE